MKVITIGKRMVLAEEVAFVEPFDPAANPEFKPEKDFKSRVVLLDRDAALTEQTPRDFAEAHGLHLFKDDDVAVNKQIVFKVEVFEPTESFKTVKTLPYASQMERC